jgi:glyoxylase-like metal-dependent hydrolase (beta-lactamase superfamily II)
VKAAALTASQKTSHALTAALTAILAYLLSCATALGEPLDAKWDAGSVDCARQPGPALEVRQYDARTFILREGLCTTFEAPFMYLLIGSEKALLIDTGDVEDPSKVGLARTVQQLLSRAGAEKLPLLVVHTHRHQDHRAGDRQLKLLPQTEVVGYDQGSVEKFYGLPDWPSGRAALNLGERAIDVIPTPGHNETEVTFYDRGTGLVFCGDFLLPGRILVDDIEAYRASAARLIDRLGDWPVTALLGGHIEMDAHGKLYKWGASYHLDERPLPMTLADLKALGAALEQFNGFYTESGGFTIMNPVRNLLAVAVPAVLAVLVLLWLLARYLRRRRGGRSATQAAA